MCRNFPLFFVTAFAAASLVTGCASKKPVETPAPIAQKAEMTPPQIFETAPVETGPVISGPVTVPYTGPLPGSAEDFNVNAGDRVFFAYNRYDLSADAMNVLRAQAQWLSNYPGVIAVIGGNADERGTREYNLALGARRAESVKDFLVSQGVAPARLTTVSYGKERPIDGRSTEEAFAMNRNGHTAVVVGGNS